MRLGLLIAGMVAVTYGPRLAPFLLLKGRGMPAFFRRFLGQLPIVALAALVIPGVLDAVPGDPFVGVGAMVVAAGAAWLSRNLIVPVVVAVAAAYLALTMLP